jgi:hypothetical protein
MNALHVNASMPRAGSELLQCLLMQHPDIYASTTSPLLEYWYGAQANMALAEVKSQPALLMDDAFTGFCRAGAVGYYGAITDRRVVVDKSRGWLEYAELLWRAFPSAKIVCMTRPVEEILESLDRVYHANPGHPDTRDLPRDQSARFDVWMQGGSMPLGLALDRLHIRQSKGADPRVCYMQYDDLCSSPVDAMRAVFEFIGVDSMDVDPRNVVKQVTEDDRHFGIFGSHSVRKIVERKHANTP